MTSRVTLARLNDSDRDAFVAALDGVFEHSPWVAEAAHAARPFATVAALHAVMMQAVTSRPVEERIAFLNVHPDLAGKAARAGEMADASVSEQAGLGLDRLSEEEYVRFATLNDAYGKRFGFPFVICVRRQTRDAVLDSFERRLKLDRDEELAAALNEIGHITRLRLAERVDGPGAPAVAGRISTHVLDTHRGGPAENVRIQLYEIGQSARALLVDTTTNADGRTDAPLLSGASLRIGTYELVFHVGDYFVARGLALGDRPFLDQIPLRFGISEPEAHYHVPLLMTPWSCSTHGGS